ncbi:MAG: BlaI/MecI/CopY family transcriptional regulator [Lachnospiraceae bacterium]|nr:BlaI/MecI/CopY family transcriptional regulator [Lachnospiraceae bacterium]MDE7272335.1 BlaI/MecI/CopY family transcriptional regulator [Lachnospiraceae bacterium]
MLKKKDVLNKREEELMNYLWEIKKPLTASEMAKQLDTEGWTNITLCRTVQSLSDNGYLEVAGLEKATKTYARKLMPSLTKEEYYSSVLMKRGISANSLADLTAALIGVSRKNPLEKDAEVIAKLEEVIDSLKAGQRKDQ